MDPRALAIEFAEVLGGVGAARLGRALQHGGCPQRIFRHEFAVQQDLAKTEQRVRLALLGFTFQRGDARPVQQAASGREDLYVGDGGPLGRSWGAAPERRKE